MNYCHKDQDLKPITLPVSKVLCVGRNYAKHALELGNEVPKEPILFIKPSTALADLEQAIVIPNDKGAVHYETEIAVLIQTQLKQSTPQDAQQAIWGYGLAFDLTLRDLQNKLKGKGQPWEKAKAFDGAAPVSRFIPKESFSQGALRFETKINNKIVQLGNTQDMLWNVTNLLIEMSNYFTLEPGDIVFTGTPEGVGSLSQGDRLLFSLGQEKLNKLNFSSSVLA